MEVNYGEFIINEGGHTFSVADIVAITDVSFGSLGAGNYAVHLRTDFASSESTPKTYIVIVDATYAQADLVALLKSYNVKVLEKLNA